MAARAAATCRRGRTGATTAPSRAPAGAAAGCTRTRTGGLCTACFTAAEDAKLPRWKHGQLPARPCRRRSPRRLRGLVDERLAQQSAGPGGTSVPAPGAGTVVVPRDPLLRGLPRGMDVRVPFDERTFGYDWTLAGWTVQPDVLVVLGEGHQVGWVEHGLDGGDGWGAVHDDYFLGDPVTEQAALHASPELVAHAIHHAHVHDLRAARGA